MPRHPLFVLLAIACLALPAPAPERRALAAPDPARLEPFQGLGAWVDIYDGSSWRNPEAVVRTLADRGVRTLYLQTTNYHRPGPIRFPRATDRFLAAAHDRGIAVVAWYLPGFRNLKRDLFRSRSAIRYTSPQGERFDGFALDIEATIVQRYWVRNRRMLWLSERIRAFAGANYPLGAIHYAPYALALRPTTWPHFPYRALARIYDVFLPMTYYSYRANGPEAVRHYLARSIEILRAKARTNVAVHPIAGIADGSDRWESRAFVRAAREYGAVGASMYDMSVMGEDDWRSFTSEAVQPNPFQTPAMPLRPWRHTGGYGNVAGGDISHPAEVVFRTSAFAGAREIDFEGFDIGAEEVDLYVNWRLAGTLAPGVPAAWTERRTMTLPDALLRADRQNVIAFVSRGRHPAWTTWGVRGVTVAPPPLPLTDRGAHGALPGAGPSWADRVTYAFESDGSPLTVVVEGFDVAAGEVRVLLDGLVVGELSPTPAGGWGSPEPIALSPAAGTHRLTFDALPNPPSRGPWGVRLTA